MSSVSTIRNIAIIAHVDHGKTTLVDGLLKQSGSFASHQVVEERAMDSMDLERERGITIMAKNASIVYGDTKINIVDTPGHADFSGEVERIMSMVQGALLLVDAAEGVLPQTRFVLKKALEQNHRVIVVVNKVDRPDSRIEEVVNQVFDLFIDLDAKESQLDFPIVYACARKQWVTLDRNAIETALVDSSGLSLRPLFDVILKEVPPPLVELEGPARMLMSHLMYSDYVGRLGLGRLEQGILKKGQKIFRIGPDRVQPFTISNLYTFQGLKQIEVPELRAGDIGLVAGCENLLIGDSLLEKSEDQPLPRIEVEPPTMSIIFSVNTSPLAGREGEPLQSRKLKERLEREVRNNVALQFPPSASTDTFCIYGRGELQFGILIEQMRREGSEFMVGRPNVLTKKQGDEVLEPMEIVYIDVPEPYSGKVTELFQNRKGVLNSYSQLKSDRVRLEFSIPTRGLIGIRSRFLTDTRGEGLLNTRFEGYAPWKGLLIHRVNGSLVADRQGKAIEYALLNLEDRGILFVEPGFDVYEGMVVGEHNRDNDLNVNCCKEKKLTNVRAAHAEVLVTLKAFRKMSLEASLEWIDDDEWIEVTPQTIRIRKKILAQNMRSVKRFDN